MKVPKKCPHCGKDIVENCQTRHLCKAKYKTYATELHLCIHYKEPIFVLLEEHWDGSACRSSKRIKYYPETNTADLPENIKALSPEAFRIYQHTIGAHDNNLNTLVGVGLRMALEQLTFDYLTKIKNKSPNNIDEMILVNRIKEMNESIYAQICMKLIRIYGNRAAHSSKNIDFTIEEIINAFETLCILIDTELTVIDNNTRLEKESNK